MSGTERQGTSLRSCASLWPFSKICPSSVPSLCSSDLWRSELWRSPATYAGNTAFTPGSGGPPYAVTPQAYAANSAQPNEWYAAPGPMRRGNMCITHVDSTRGYGYQEPCKK